MPEVDQDPYVNRPLPHLIGSRPFIENEDVGIGDLEDTEGLYLV